MCSKSDISKVGEQSTVAATEAKEGAEKEPEAAENAAETNAANEDETTPRKSGRKVKPTEKVLEVRFLYCLEKNTIFAK